MATKKYQEKFPPKVIIQPDGAQVEFKKINQDFSSGIYVYPATGYQELYPSVYSIEIPGEGFTKLYDFFPNEYLENKGLINYDQFSLYNYISSLRNRGYYVSLHGRKNRQGKDDKEADVKGLAQIVGIHPTTLTGHLDHLEDCLLIHRVRRLDLQGMPSELVVHSPFTKKELEGGKQNIILDRASRQHTRRQREKAVTKSTSPNGKKYGFLDRKATAERFQMNYQFIRNAFGENARRFADFALHFFKENLKLLRANKSEFEYAYRAQLKRQLSDWGIAENTARETCYIAANKFRVIYCPLDVEIFG